jgi:methionyl-tRNA synthetase
LLDQLGQSRDSRDFAALDRWVESGLELPAPQGIFPRLELPAKT